MTLTSAQRKHLRSLGQTRPDDVRIGKAGLSEGFVANLDTLLNRQELVKLRFTELEGDQRRTLADEIAGSVGAEVVAVVGRTILLYRARPEETPADESDGG